jgi:hypothetical protein
MPALRQRRRACAGFAAPGESLKQASLSNRRGFQTGEALITGVVFDHRSKKQAESVTQPQPGASPHDSKASGNWGVTLITRRVLLAIAFVLLVASGSCAEELPEVPRATELPPLLVPPTGDPYARPPIGPRGPSGEYDHNLLYIPESAPPEVSQPPETCRPLGRWWVDTSLALGWLPTTSAPGSIRLRVPNGTGGTTRGPVLPVGCVMPSDFLPGFSLNVGAFLTESHTSAIEGSFFTIGPGATTFESFARGMLVIFPGGASSSSPVVTLLPPPLNKSITSVLPSTFSTWFTDADVNYRHTLYCAPNVRLDALAGYRFAYLQDELFLGDVPDAGSDDYKQNRLAVSNAFHGGQVGLEGEYRLDKWFVSGTAKVGLGAVITDISTTGFFIGAQGKNPSGGYSRLLALTDPHQSRFGVLPSVNLTAGRQVRDHLRVFVGYSFQYLNNVTRLGDVLDATATSAKATDFWVQTINLGLEVRY